MASCQFVPNIDLSIAKMRILRELQALTTMGKHVTLDKIHYITYISIYRIINKFKNKNKE